MQLAMHFGYHSIRMGLHHMLIANLWENMWAIL